MSLTARIAVAGALAASCAWACSDSGLADAGGDASIAAGGDASVADSPTDGWPSGSDNLAEFVEQSVPASTTVSQTFAATVTMRNTGTTTWSAAAGYFLGSANPQDNVIWGTNRGAMATSVQVPPQTNYTFNLDLVSPANAGDYGMRWQMLQEGVEWFGATTDDKTISVAAAQLDPIDLKTVVLHDSLDVSDWAVTKTITGIELSAVNGVKPTLSPYNPAKDGDSWPDFVMWPPDTLRYTLWLFVPIAGKWHGAAVLEYWYDRDWTGAPLLTNYGDWIYPNPGSPWGEMGDYVPKEGDQIGFMATAGDLRRSKNVLSVQERTNVVMVKLVPDAVYTFP